MIHRTIQVTKERLGLAVHRAEEGTVAVFADPGGLDVLPQPDFQIVLAGHLVALSAFLVQPDPEGILFREDILTFMPTAAVTRAKV